MAKANRKATQNIKGVKLTLPSPEIDRDLHATLGFEYGLEFADKLISYTIANGVLPADYYAHDIRQIISRSDDNCTLPTGFLAALVTILSSTATHASVAAIREARARAL